MVEAAAYVIGPGSPPETHETKFIRLLKDPDRANGLSDAVAADRVSGQTIDASSLSRSIGLQRYPPGAGRLLDEPSIRRLFTDLPQLEGSAAEARQGLATGDDFRFVRTFWEVDPMRIARTADETHEGRRWSPFVKGGEYSPYWFDVHLVIDYEREGEDSATSQALSSGIRSTTSAPDSPGPANSQRVRSADSSGWMCLWPQGTCRDRRCAARPAGVAFKPCCRRADGRQPASWR